jgi:TetR/AcrR family transcriptional regulator
VPASTRRFGTETSKTRAVLLDVTERLMLESGYAAVSSRTVAERAGVKAPLVHYYFRTLDDLFIAVYRRRTEQNLERLAASLQETDQPLWVIWEYSSDKTGTALTQEFIALANHRKAIQAEIAKTAERLRQIQLTALAGLFHRRYGLDADLITPGAVLLFMSAVPRVIVIEEALGISTGHVDAVALVEHYLTQLEGPRAPAKEEQATTRRRPA